MDAEDKADTARVWDRALKDVPEFSIEELYDRVMCSWSGSFPPGLGDFRQAFDAWLDNGFWEEHNGEAEFKDDGILALPEAPPKAGPGYRTAQIQIARFKRGLSPVQCECRNEFDNLDAAILNEAMDTWICQHSREGKDLRSRYPTGDKRLELVNLSGTDCGFRLPLDATDTAKVRRPNDLTEREIITRLSDCCFPMRLVSKPERLIAFGQWANRALPSRHWNVTVLLGLFGEWKRQEKKQREQEAAAENQKAVAQ